MQYHTFYVYFLHLLCSYFPSVLLSLFLSFTMAIYHLSLNR